jgi:hypothetical protein
MITLNKIINKINYALKTRDPSLISLQKFATCPDPPHKKFDKIFIKDEIECLSYPNIIYLIIKNMPTRPENISYIKHDRRDFLNIATLAGVLATVEACVTPSMTKDLGYNNNLERLPVKDRLNNYLVSLDKAIFLIEVKLLGIEAEFVNDDIEQLNQCFEKSGLSAECDIESVDSLNLNKKLEQLKILINKLRESREYKILDQIQTKVNSKKQSGDIVLDEDFKLIFDAINLVKGKIRMLELRLENIKKEDQP